MCVCVRVYINYYLFLQDCSITLPLSFSLGRISYYLSLPTLVSRKYIFTYKSQTFGSYITFRFSVFTIDIFPLSYRLQSPVFRNSSIVSVSLQIPLNDIRHQTYVKFLNPSMFQPISTKRVDLTKKRIRGTQDIHKNKKLPNYLFK